MTFIARIITLALALGLPAFSAFATAQDMAGITEIGQAGIRFTTDQLMQQDRLNQMLTAGTVRPPRIKPVLRPTHPKQGGDAGDYTAGAMADALRAPALDVQALSTNFLGAQLSDTNAFPPDSMGAVGPTQFIVAVNGRFRSFNKTTGVADGVLNINPDTFFNSVMTPPAGNNFTSDPRIRYDRLSGRWFIEIIDVPGAGGTITNRSLIAVSDAASAGIITGSTVWTFYFFTATAGQFADYCTMGIDVNALYIGCNMFSISTGSYTGTDGYVVRKSSVLSGGPIAVTAFPGLVPSPAGAGPFTPQGVDNYDPAATEGYFIGVDNAAFSLLSIIRISNPGSATPTKSSPLTVTVPTTSFPFTVPHSGNTGGTNGKLDGLDDRLYAAHLRNGRLWTAQNIAVSATGVATSSTATGRNGVRWYELQNLTTTPALVQSGTVFDSNATLANAHWYWIPSIMVSGQGHAAVGFSMAGASFFADAGYTGRYAGDAAGTMQGAPVNITNTAAAYNPPSDPGGTSGRRWGDFSYTSLDPLDDMTMWTIQEYANATNSYGVRAAKLLAPPPATPASVAPPSVAAGQASVNVTITGTQVSGSGFYDPGPNLSAPALPFNHLAATIPGVVVNSVTYNSPTSVTLNLSTLASTVGTKSVTITNPDGQARTGTNILTVTPGPGPATHFSVSAPASATAGSAFSVTVTALDAGNATATGYTGTVHFTASDGAAVLPANTTLVNGVGTISATLKTAGAQTITASDTVSASITGTSASINVGAAAATHYAVSAPPAVAAGSAFSFTVTALDAFNNTATAYAGTVHFTSTDGAAVLPANSTLSTGVGSFSATLNTAGTRTITATDTVTASITGTSAGINVSAIGVATHFSVSAPASATSGSPFSVTVTALDVTNATATGYTGTVHFSTSDGAAALPPNSTLSSGVGTFPVTLNTIGNQTITATDTIAASITGTSAAIAVTATPPVLQSVKSRKVHGSAGTFDLTLALTPLNPTTESRAGPAQTLVFTFDKPVTSGSASVTESAAAAGAPTFSGTEMTVPLSSVPNAQYVTVNVSGVVAADGGAGGAGSIRVGFLFGDASQSRQVTVADVGIINAALLQAVTNANFLLDINVDGRLTVADKGLANANLLVKLPVP
ncbi:MAG TPA: hypothetical protein PLW68_11710 [Casimicrobiaceae bacterium]|nr:hypothetical protein [Casimicrobiaceae bacterium]